MTTSARYQHRSQNLINPNATKTRMVLLLTTILCSCFTSPPLSAVLWNTIPSSSFFVSADSASASTTTAEPISQKGYKLVQVQIIHRHGDRTPITPLKNEEYWSKTLPSPQILAKVAEGTKIVRHSDNDESDTTTRDDGALSKVSHAALGIGPFGKLTQLGLFQMVEVGSKLRDELVLDDQDDDIDHHHNDGIPFLNKGRLFTPKNELHPSKIKVVSTDFPRTLQSVQGLLVGFFPDGMQQEKCDLTTGEDDDADKVSSSLNNNIIEIDARHTDSLIPDPQPRLTKGQVELERILAQQPHVVEKESELYDVALRTTVALQHLIGENARDMAFGIGEDNTDGEDKDNKETDSSVTPLSITQLAEIMKCLKTRDMLPSSISDEDHHAIASYAAFKWFDSLRNKELAKLAMKQFMDFVMGNLHRGSNRCGGGEEDGENSSNCSYNHDEEPWLHIYSCHDSSLIGLMCAFRLEQPSVWPEYGSYIKIELFELVDESSDDGEEISGDEKKHFVRFSLNGSVLKSVWGLGEETYSKPSDMIPFDHLVSAIEREHGYAHKE